MSGGGYGISGHKNAFSSRVKIGNYVEDQFGAQLAKKSVSCAQNGRSEVQDQFADPSTRQSSETEPLSPEELTQAHVQQGGLSYNLIFPHGPQGKEGTSADWCTTNQLLHGSTPIQSRKVYEDGSDVGPSHVDMRSRHEKTIEMQKRLAREKRAQNSYVSTTQASSALVRKR